MVNANGSNCFDNRYSPLELKNPDFVAISIDLDCLPLSKSKRELSAAFRCHVRYIKGPYVLEVVIEKRRKLIPDSA